MSKHGFTWEPLEVTTEDGFILTTFHITGNQNGKFTSTQPPVLLMHGDYSDGARWLAGLAGLPMHLQLAEAGYDVWIGNNRGTEYSQQHISLTVDQPEFWAWSWAEMGIYDDVALIRAIKEHSSAEKVFFIGSSQGTVQMFYALAHREEEFFADNLHKFIALAPCTICPKQGPESYWEDVLYTLPEIDVYSLYGNRSKHQSVCEEKGDEACAYARRCLSCQSVSV